MTYKTLCSLTFRLLSLFSCSSCSATQANFPFLLSCRRASHSFPYPLCLANTLSSICPRCLMFAHHHWPFKGEQYSDFPGRTHSPAPASTKQYHNPWPAWSVIGIQPVKSERANSRTWGTAGKHHFFSGCAETHTWSSWPPSSHRDRKGARARERRCDNLEPHHLAGPAASSL